MKLKYYLRGLGIGILVTAVIMGIASGKRKMTDEEVRARARELGMVESTVLSNIAEITQPEDVQSDNALRQESKPEESKPEESKPVEGAPEESKPSEGTPVMIVIRSGQSSASVSKMLAEAGLVEDASAYDSFLCENGYDKKILTGTYEIDGGVSEEEIARIITGR